MSNTTIAAISTPVGTGGIGIIRISGPDALIISSKIFSSSKDAKLLSCHQQLTGLPSSKFESHRVYYGHIFDPSDNRIIDEALLIFMQAPRSYTMEDVVEIQAHSGYFVLASILELLIKNGAALAEPGEFTKRAFINGRLDLTEAEAVIDIINARTDIGLQIAVSQASGVLKTNIRTIRDYAYDKLIMVEAAIDFPEDVSIVNDYNTNLKNDFQRIIVEQLESILAQYDDAHYFRDGIKAFIVGRPNVGKSSIMNCLAQKDRVIVTPVPGTTRDLIEETININGVSVTLVDTAGLQDSNDFVENIGITKVRDNIEYADLILFVIDASSPFVGDDIKIYESIKDKSILYVFNKIDLVEDGFVPAAPDSLYVDKFIKTSAVLNTGIARLKSMIVNTLVTGHDFDFKDSIVLNLRQKHLIENCLNAFRDMQYGLENGLPLELIAIDIKAAIGFLDEITGDSASDNVLDEIFGRFCIGK